MPRGTLGQMTTQQLHLFNCLYAVVCIVFVLLTRATRRRTVGAIVGSAVGGIVAIGILDIAERAGLWHFELSWEPYFLAVLWIDFALCAFVFLITWRIARRFGGRGLAITLILVSSLSPFRDQWYLRQFPEWGSYSPGIAPLLAIAGTYIVLGVVGHGIMRLIAGPANADRLAKRPWESGDANQILRDQRR